MKTLSDISRTDLERRYIDLALVAGLLNEKKIIRWEDRMIGKVRRRK